MRNEKKKKKRPLKVIEFWFFLAIIILLSTFRDPEFHHVWFLEGIGEIRPKNENEKKTKKKGKKKKKKKAEAKRLVAQLAHSSVFSGTFMIQIFSPLL